MAVPSSPPLPAQDAFDLPSLDASDHDLRKRHYADYDSLSSDPVFSEDASESDERTGRKKKRLFKGPWWANTAFAPGGSANGHKTKLPADSGVWLASESSEASFSQNEQYTHRQRYMRGSSPPLPEDDPEPTVQDNPALPTAEDLAARWIWQCVEEHRQTIDLR